MNATSTSTQTAKTTPALDPNPIPHLTEGVKNMVRSNLKPLLATITASLVIPVGLLIAAYVSTTNYTNAQLLWDAAKDNVVTLGVVGIVVLIVSLFFWLALNRVILLGARAEHTSFGATFSFSLDRLFPSLGVYVVLSLALSLPAIGIVLLMWQANPLFGILFLPLVVAYIAASFFLAPLDFVLVESRPLGSLVAILKNLLALWKHGFLVLFVYILCMNFVSGGFSSVTNSIWSFPSGGDSSTSEFIQPKESSDMVVLQDGVEVEADKRDDFKLENIEFDYAGWVIGVGGFFMLFIITISTIMQSFLLAGFAHAYSAVDVLRQHKLKATPST